MSSDERTMFEIYRESDYNRAFRYIFYTELEEHGRDSEIARAASGVTVFSGFFADAHKEEARRVVEEIVDELNVNDEEEPDPNAIRAQLAQFLVENPANVSPN